MHYSDWLQEQFNGEGNLLFTLLEECDKGDLISELFDTGSITFNLDDKDVVLTLQVQL